MSISQQEKAQTREALKREIALASNLIEKYEKKIVEVTEIEGGEREVLRCRLEIEGQKKIIEAAANSLGIRPSEKRGPGRPPKSA